MAWDFHSYKIKLECNIVIIGTQCVCECVLSTEHTYIHTMHSIASSYRCACAHCWYTRYATCFMYRVMLWELLSFVINVLLLNYSEFGSICQLACIHVCNVYCAVLSHCMHNS